ncbi:hypothetical protein ACIOHS_46505 [Streptomyces sp. NPDC088253]|uniref:hypothetical protein n=1 Tax=Streptomyces sp. NPDC088253 TaxID=3365846 RepID=UPI003809B5DB
MIDRRPAAVARYGDAGDMRDAVTAVRDRGLEIAGRDGAHSGPGLCPVDDGVTVDLSPMSGGISESIARAGSGSAAL